MMTLIPLLGFHDYIHTIEMINLRFFGVPRILLDNLGLFRDFEKST
jgi:hypothetical protein